MQRAPSLSFQADRPPVLRIALLAGLLGLLAGCGPRGEAPPAGPAAPAAAAPFRVGLLTAGALTDSGWNSLAGQALRRIGSELGAETSHQSQDVARAEQALRGFARNGCRLVFAHGTEFGDAARRVASEYPETSFVISSGEATGPNLASLRFHLGEASYLAGMAAAGLSRSGRAGQIGGQDFPPVAQGFRLFEAGAKAVNPRFRTHITYLGNWHDANRAKEQALAMIRDGADVLFQNCDAAGEGVFLAAEERGGVIVIGSNADQNPLKPALIAASAVLDIPRLFLTVARDVREGRFRGGTYDADLASGHVYLSLNPRFEQRIPPAVREKIRRAEADIRAGRLDPAARAAR